MTNRQRSGLSHGLVSAPLSVELYVGKLRNMSYTVLSLRSSDRGRAAPGERAESARKTDCFATWDASRKAADFFYLCRA